MMVSSRDHLHDTRPRAGVDLSVRPHSRWIISVCTAMITTITGARWMTKALKSRPTCEPIRMLGGIADQGRGAADVGSEDLGEQKRIGRDIQAPW